MGGFKITKDSFKKKEKQNFFGIETNETAEEKQLSKEQNLREIGMSIEDSKVMDERVKVWKNNPAMSQNVLAVVPKKSAFVKDYLDVEEDAKLKQLRKEYWGSKLDKKSASLAKSIQKQKNERKKKALDLAKKSVKQEKELYKWDVKHRAKLEGLQGEKKTRHLAGLTGKMQAFSTRDLYVGSLDSDAGIMKAFEKYTKMEKDMRRLKTDSEFFRESLDGALLEDFAAKYTDYVTISNFLKKLVIKMSQGKKRTANDLSEINHLLGEKVLIKGTSAEMIFTDSVTQLKKGETGENKKAKLKEALENPDMTAEVQQLHKNNVAQIPLVNESRNLVEKSREIEDKWEEQGEETVVLDEKNEEIKIPKLNPNDVGPKGKWKPVKKNGKIEMVSQTVALRKEALRNRLKEQTQRRRYGGYTADEIWQKMSESSDAEWQKLKDVYQKGEVEMKDHVRGYSGMAYQPINNALRNGVYGKVEVNKNKGIWREDVKGMVEDLKNDVSGELPEELSLTRHGDLGGLACMFGLPYSSVNNVEDLMERIGQLPDNGFLIRDKAFLSTTIIKDGVLQGDFRQGQVEFRILAPKGTRGLYIEEMSLFPDTEQELLLDAGTIFRVTKIDATGEWTSKKAMKANNKKVVVYMEAIPKKVGKKAENKAENKEEK